MHLSVSFFSPKASETPTFCTIFVFFLLSFLVMEWRTWWKFPKNILKVWPNSQSHHKIYLTCFAVEFTYFMILWKLKCTCHAGEFIRKCAPSINNKTKQNWKEKGSILHVPRLVRLICSTSIKSACVFFGIGSLLPFLSCTLKNNAKF